MIFQAFKIAISTYSKIPVSRVQWNEKNMKYALCFFPLIGIIIGIAVNIFFRICSFYNMGSLFSSCISSLIPILITGGIHMDGFMDTLDALCSYTNKEKKLAILKDPNTGAFAVIGCISFFILNIALWSEVSSEIINIISISYIFSRSLSGLAIATFPLARNTGLAAQFSNSSHKRITSIAMTLYITACFAASFCINAIYTFVYIVCGIIIFLYVKCMSKKQFGGITGDVAGYLLESCETIILLSLVITDKIIKGSL